MMLLIVTEFVLVVIVAFLCAIFCFFVGEGIVGDFHLKLLLLLLFFCLLLLLLFVWRLKENLFFISTFV